MLLAHLAHPLPPHVHRMIRDAVRLGTGVHLSPEHVHALQLFFDHLPHEDECDLVRSGGELDCTCWIGDVPK